MKLPGELRKISGLSSMSLGTLKLLAETGDIEAAITLGKIYEDGGISFGLARLYEEGEITSKDEVKAEISEDGKTAKITSGKKEYTVDMITARDYAEAVKWYKKAAYDGSRIAQNALAYLYFRGGFNISQSYYDSYVWCCVSDMTEQYSVAMVVATGVVTGVAAVAEVAIGTIGTGVATLAGASILLPVVGVFAGISYLAADFTADKSIKEEIEGAGLFNLAKLSDAEMNRAKDDARKIMAEIERNIKAKQQ